MDTKQKKTTYTVGFIRGACMGTDDNASRGEVRDGVDINLSARLAAVNRAVILGNSSEKKDDVGARVKDFKAQVAEEDKAMKAHADEQIAAGANLAAQVKALQAELAQMRKAIA